MRSLSCGSLRGEARPRGVPGVQQRAVPERAGCLAVLALSAGLCQLRGGCHPLQQLHAGILRGRHGSQGVRSLPARILLCAQRHRAVQTVRSRWISQPCRFIRPCLPHCRCLASCRGVCRLTGTYQGGAGSAATSCSPCAAGSVSAAAQGSCTVCSAGTASNAQSTDCDDCPSGRFSLAGSSSCTLLCYPVVSVVVPLSTHHSLALLLSFSTDPCVDVAGTNCSLGSAAPQAHSSSCDVCGPGRYANRKQDDCVACPVGKASAASGQSSATVCVSCGVGAIAGAGAAACAPCEPGKYQTGPAACTPCFLGRFTDAAGATACMCLLVRCCQLP
jgi:hypothetical protein